MKLYFILLSFLFVGVCHAQKVTCINSNEIDGKKRNWTDATI